MPHTEQKLASEEIFSGVVVHLRKDAVLLENGKTATREVIDHPGGVCVLAVTDEGKVPFVRQFRYPFGEEFLELPAGKLEPGEDPQSCGERELKEEVGYTAKTFTSLGSFVPNCAYDTSVLHLFLAEDLTFTGQKLDPDEFLTVEYYDIQTAVQMAGAGQIPDAKTQLALLRYGLLKHKGIL